MVKYFRNVLLVFEESAWAGATVRCVDLDCEKTCIYRCRIYWN